MSTIIWVLQGWPLLSLGAVIGMFIAAIMRGGSDRPDMAPDEIDYLIEENERLRGELARATVAAEIGTMPLSITVYRSVTKEQAGAALESVVANLRRQGRNYHGGSAAKGNPHLIGDHGRDVVIPFPGERRAH